MKPSDIFTIGFFTAAIPITIYSFLMSNRLPYEDGFGWSDVGFIVGGFIFWQIIHVIFDRRYKLTKVVSNDRTVQPKQQSSTTDA